MRVIGYWLYWRWYVTRPAMGAVDMRNRPVLFTYSDTPQVPARGVKL